MNSLQPFTLGGVDVDYSNTLIVSALFFFLLFLAAIQIGRIIGRRIYELGADDPKPALSAIEACIFALLGLLVAFMFSGAAQRMAERRVLIVQEANAIGTAWLRIDLAGAGQRKELRALFQRYVDARMQFNRELSKIEGGEATQNAVAHLQQEIWDLSMQAAENTPPPLAASYVASVNEMFDAAGSLTVAQRVHPPILTYVFLCILALTCACFVGIHLARSNRGSLFHQLVFAGLVCFALYVIVDFEFPRIGTIRIDDSDRIFQSLRQSMKHAS